MTAQEHNKTLGITHLVYGSLHLLVLMAVFVFFLFILLTPLRDYESAGYFVVFGLILSAFGLLFTLPSLVAGYALLKQKSWARTAAIVAGILAKPFFPYGTALCVYTLWFMFCNKGKTFYENNAGGRSPETFGALPGMPGAGNWAAGTSQQQRERAYVPPPNMPDWR
jgi:hypothetical protein